MKKWLFKILLSLYILLLSGSGHLYTQKHQLSKSSISSAYIIVEKKSSEGLFLNKIRSAEFKQQNGRCCVLDTEDTEEEFSSNSKGLLKNSYFLNFLDYNNPAVHSSVFISNKANYCKIVSLLSNKIYRLFQVFRI
jgi:hypothetical protein